VGGGELVRSLHFKSSERENNLMIARRPGSSLLLFLALTAGLCLGAVLSLTSAGLVPR
jgi:hypothetical protein